MVERKEGGAQMEAVEIRDRIQNCPVRGHGQYGEARCPKCLLEEPRVKGCACGKTFTAAAWSRLPFPPGGGIQQVAEDLESCSCGFRESDARTRLSGWPPAGVVGHRTGCLGAPGALEMRNCPCGSTLVLPVEA
jgi:hypothetical protein